MLTRLLLSTSLSLALASVAVAAPASGSDVDPVPSATSLCKTHGEPYVVATELAGVPARIRVSAAISAPPIVLWHGFGPPADEAALMALLPLDEVPAVKVYLGLPMFGQRAPADPGLLARRQGEDLATGVFEPVVMAAADELPAVLASLRSHGCLDADEGISLFGFSAGGAATLYALAERGVPVRSAVVLNASTGLSASVAAYERATGQQYQGTPRSLALARRSDAISRVSDLVAGSPPPAVLIVQGADDALLGGFARELHDALRPHYLEGMANRLVLAEVDGLPHLVQARGDVERVRDLVGAWFRQFAGDPIGVAYRRAGVDDAFIASDPG